MREYVITITDETKEDIFLALLRDLSYVKIKPKPEERILEKRFPLMDNPIPVKNVKKFSREELHER